MVNVFNLESRAAGWCEYLGDLKMTGQLRQMVSYLWEQRSDIVKEKQVMVEGYFDPTYGLQDPRTETIEVIDFDALLNAIDDFARTYK